MLVKSILGGALFLPARLGSISRKLEIITFLVSDYFWQSGATKKVLGADLLILNGEYAVCIKLVYTNRKKAIRPPNVIVGSWLKVSLTVSHLLGVCIYRCVMDLSLTQKLSVICYLSDIQI